MTGSDNARLLLPALLDYELCYWVGWDWVLTEQN